MDMTVPVRVLIMSIMDAICDEGVEILVTAVLYRPVWLRIAVKASLLPRELWTNYPHLDVDGQRIINLRPKK